jgi:hypothetical protein
LAATTATVPPWATARTASVLAEPFTMRRLRLCARLRDWGVTDADVGTLVAGVSGNLGNDPAGATTDADYLRALFTEAL